MRTIADRVATGAPLLATASPSSMHRAGFEDTVETLRFDNRGWVQASSRPMMRKGAEFTCQLTVKAGGEGGDPCVVGKGWWSVWMRGKRPCGKTRRWWKLTTRY